MTKKRRKRKKPIAKPQFNLPNIAILGLSVIIAIALFSAVDKIFYSDNKIEFNTNTDLASLLTVSKYEKEMGIKIKIQLLNGCGKKRLAENYAKFFLEYGHDVLEKRNAIHFNYKHTEIISRTANIKAANVIADLLGISKNQIRTEIDPKVYCDITLILGNDYDELSSFNEVLKINPPF